MWKSLGIWNVFNTLTLKRVFWKTKTFLKILEYSFLAQSTMNESAACLYKTALSKLNVKTNWMGSTKMDLSQRTYFCHWLLHSFENLILVSARLPNSWFHSPITKIYIFILFVSVSVLFEGVFSLWVSLKLESGRLKIKHTYISTNIHAIWVSDKCGRVLIMGWAGNFSDI